MAASLRILVAVFVLEDLDQGLCQGTVAVERQFAVDDLLHSMDGGLNTQRVVRLELQCGASASNACTAWVSSVNRHRSILGAALFRELQGTIFVRMPLDLPVAVSIFKGDMFTPPKVWGERTYSKLFYWNEVPKDFAALEQPELFVGELRKAFHQAR